MTDWHELYAARAKAIEAKRNALTALGYRPRYVYYPIGYLGAWGEKPYVMVHGLYAFQSYLIPADTFYVIDAPLYIVPEHLRSRPLDT